MIKIFRRILFIFCISIQNIYPYPADINTCFSPHENCLNLLIHEIDNAKQSIYVHAYSFTNDMIANALIGAKKRGVNVCLYIDKGRDKETHSKTEKLRENEIPVIIQSHNKRGLAHNKIMIIDSYLIITGSFNWSKNALTNEENINFIRSHKLAEIYMNNWNYIINEEENKN